MYKHLARFLFTAILLFSLGCSVFMAIDQPDKKNVDLFRVGTPGSVLLGESGAPAVSETQSGRKYEIFKFVQGYSTGEKAGRALVHGAADVATFGLWEVVRTPTEANLHRRRDGIGGFIRSGQ